MESYKLAVSNAYAIPKNGQLGQEYFDKNLPVVTERLQMGGVRLAALLNLIFDSGKPLPFEKPDAGWLKNLMR